MYLIHNNRVNTKDGPIITFKFYLSCNLIVPLINLIAPLVATQLRHFQTIAAPSLVNTNSDPTGDFNLVEGIIYKIVHLKSGSNLDINGDKVLHLVHINIGRYERLMIIIIIS